MSDDAYLGTSLGAVNAPVIKPLTHDELSLMNELRLSRQRQTVLELEVLNSRDHAVCRAV